MNFLENKALMYEIENQNQNTTRHSFDDVMMWYEIEKLFNCESEAWKPEQKITVSHKIAVTVASYLRNLADLLDPGKACSFQA